MNKSKEKNNPEKKSIHSNQIPHETKEPKAKGYVKFFIKVIKSKAAEMKKIMENRFKIWRKNTFKDIKFNKVINVGFSFAKDRSRKNRKRSITVTKTVHINKIEPKEKKATSSEHRKIGLKTKNIKKIPYNKNKVIKIVPYIKNENYNNSNIKYIDNKKLDTISAVPKVNKIVNIDTIYHRDNFKSPSCEKKVFMKNTERIRSPIVYRNIRADSYKRGIFENNQKSLNVSDYKNTTYDYKKKTVENEPIITKDMLKKGVSFAIQHYQGRREVHNNLKKNKIY